MAYKFNSEDKEDTSTEITERLPFGVSSVQLVGATAGETESNKEYIALTVTNKDGVEEDVRVWFTGGASKYSFNTIKQIVIHNQTSDANKEKAREAVENCVDTDSLADLLNSKVVGGQLWITKYFDPVKSYVNPSGEQRRSINTNVVGYEPKPKPELMALTQLGLDAVRPVTADDLISIRSTTEKIEIPGEWA